MKHIQQLLRGHFQMKPDLKEELLDIWEMALEEAREKSVAAAEDFVYQALKELE